MLVDGWQTWPKWVDYVNKLVDAYEIPEKDRKPLSKEICYSTDCRAGWLLEGELAIAHARRVHERIHRQVLSLERVSAIDVGFAILEGRMAFGKFLSIRVHVNRKQPVELLAQGGLASLTLPYYRFAGAGMGNLLFLLDDSFTETRDEQTLGPDPNCSHPERWRQLRNLLRRDLRGRRSLLRELRRYPISGVGQQDLSICTPPEVTTLRTLGDIRLCIFGVPIDIINARYRPSVAHPGGDADRGVFTKKPRRSNRLDNEEQLLIGRGRVNPLAGGLSVGSVTAQAGTLGAVVWDKTDGTPCVLSNWHVLAGTTAAQVGQPTYQPALFDGGTEDDVVATLKRWHLGDKGDAALAELIGCRDYASGEILGLWHPISGYRRPELNMEIRKWGRTSGFTRGFIDGIQLATNIDYGNGVIRYFKDQFHIAPLREGDDVSQVGDSGSLVLTSFRPQDLRESFSTLYEWLKQCCDGQGGPRLCEDICVEGGKLLSDCRKWSSSTLHNATQKAINPLIEEACQETGQELCHYILRDCDNLTSRGKKIDADLYDLTKSYYEKLPRYRVVVDRYFCDMIQDHAEEFKEKCSSITQCAIFCARVERASDELYEAAKRTSLSACVICDQIDRSAKLLEGEREASEGCGSFYRYVRFLLNRLKRACDDCADRELLCQLIRSSRRVLAARCGTLVQQAEFCRRASETLEGWYEQCREIVEGGEQAEKICRAVDEQCQDAPCKNPLTIVECIQECICKEESKENLCQQGTDNKPPNGPLEELLKDLHYQSDDEPGEFVQALRDLSRNYQQNLREKEAQNTTRAYYAVGMIFAGDTPGSPLGEFAVASDIQELEDELRFSLRPVFEPRSSFRELRVRPQRQGRADRASRFGSGSGLTPGDQNADPRGGGPQPDPEPSIDDSANRPPPSG